MRTLKFSFEALILLTAGATGSVNEANHCTDVCLDVFPNPFG